jgi:hypothetical protein
MAYEILADSTAWLPNDSENLAHFLDTETGKRLLPQLAGHCPVLLDKGDVNAILIRSGEVRAWTGMIESLLNLAHPAPVVNMNPATEYPELTNDAAWNDGQRIETEDQKPPQ